MEGKQKIACTVESCEYNTEKHTCSLEKIKVTPINNCNTCKPDESMCSSYKYCE